MPNMIRCALQFDKIIKTTHYFLSVIFFFWLNTKYCKSSHCGAFEAEHPKRYMYQNGFLTPKWESHLGNTSQVKTLRYCPGLSHLINTIAYWKPSYLLAKAMVKTKICTVYQRHNMRKSSIVQVRCSHNQIPLPLTYYCL